MARQTGEDSTSEQAATHWLVAVLLGMAAVAISLYFDTPSIFDINSPEFNPVVAVPLLAVAFYQAALGTLGTMRRRRFGWPFGPPANPHCRFKASVSIPFMRGRVMTSEAPKARRWQLDVSAPMGGPDYRARFAVTVQ